MTTTTSSSLRRFLPALSLQAFMAAVFFWLTSRSHGLNPTIFADEWYYSKMSRLQALSEAIVPSYLYLWLFRGSNACGTGFLECVRGLNTLLFVAAAPFVYLSARTVAGRAVAFVVAVLATLAPLNLFTAYFMPEATYYFGFWVLSWIVLTRRDWHWAVHALVTGAVLGLMSLVKVHALFLIPALCLYLCYARWMEGGTWLSKGLASMILAACAVLALKFGLGYLLAGNPGLSVFGPFYSEAATVANTHSRWHLLAPAFTSFSGHMMVLTVVFGLPLALLIQAVLRPSPRREAGPADLLRVYALLMLCAAAGMTVVYTASLAAPDNQEAIRLHLRYYSFVFPLLWMVVAANLKGETGRSAGTPLRWILALLLGAILVAALIKLPSYWISASDGPEVRAVAPDGAAGRWVAGLGIAVLLVWAVGSRAAFSLFLFVAAPAFVASGIASNGKFLAQFHLDNDADLAGKFAYRTIPPAEHGQITVAGSGGALMRAQFHIDSKDTVLLDLPENAPIAAYQMPRHNKWLLVFGNHPLPPGVQPVAVTPQYALVRLDNDFRTLGRASLSNPFGSGLIASAEGLSHSETIGRWSDAKRVVLHLNIVLPRRVNILIRGWAFGDNAKRPFTLRIGDSSSQFRLGGGLEEVGLSLDTDGKQRDIVIEVPHPVSPQSYGNSTDSRELGILLQEIEVSTPAH
jgi:hypothetical protein